MSLERLYATLRQRKRPEDVAQLILETGGADLTRDETRLLERAAANALKRRVIAYTSMLEDFAQPVGAGRQVAKAVELFAGAEPLSGERYDEPAAVEAFIRQTGAEIRKAFGASDFKDDRLNRQAREESGLELSRRRYNKLFRHLARMEEKLARLTREWRKYELTLTGKSGLASRLTWEVFSQDADSAYFIAYLTARSNLRSEFTIAGQQRPYDEIADALFRRCRESGGANWYAIAHVHPHAEVFARLTDEAKGEMLGRWYAILQDAGDLLAETWDRSDINRETMVVRRGNDSSTWNNTANAWNKARDNWIGLLYAMEMESLLDVLCPGKALRLMAADVVAWHLRAGGGLDPNTLVWRDLPLPWRVLSGEASCDRPTIEAVCAKHGLDPRKTGWSGPRPRETVARYRPTPELVHGVTVANPVLATLLKRAGFFSGKPKKVVARQG
jgi:hypothetical protein